MILSFPFGEYATRNNVVRKLVIGAVLIQSYEALRLLKGQRPQQYGANDGEQSSRRANPECYYEDSGKGKTRRPGKGPHTQPQTLTHLFEAYPAPSIPGFFLEDSRISESSHRGIASLFAAHARGDVLEDLLFEMKLNFVV